MPPFTGCVEALASCASWPRGRLLQESVFASQIRVLCLDTLAEAVDCCFEARSKGALAGEAAEGEGVRADGSWLQVLVPFLIEALAAFEPRSWGHQQFHSASLYGVTAEAFERARVSLSQTSRSARTLKTVVRNANAAEVPRLLALVKPWEASAVGKEGS